jgi:N-acyl amino acid synthase of PEP-CTERM/exosortase system
MTTQQSEDTDFAPGFRCFEIPQDGGSELMQQAFRLRFHVYCIECGFLSAADCPQQLESDAQDAHSAHFCALNQRDELVGYVRLVRPDAAQAFPFQQHCGVLNPGMALVAPAKSAEISRLMVRQDYRRRSGDLLAGVTAEPVLALPAQERRDHSAQILLGLYRQMYAFSRRNGIRYWYAAMERALARILTRMQFNFLQIGPQADYYGPVAPYRLDLRELEIRLEERRPQLMAWLRGA